MSSRVSESYYVLCVCVFYKHVEVGPTCVPNPRDRVWDERLAATWSAPGFQKVLEAAGEAQKHLYDGPNWRQDGLRRS